MGVAAALAVAAIGAGVSAYGANAAGKKAAGAAGQGAKKLRATSKYLDKYRKKFDSPGILALDAIRHNIANIGPAKDLTGRINRANEGELVRMLNNVLPGYQSAVGRALKNTKSWIRGEIPQDVADQIKDQTAEAALVRGFSGSPAARALTARDLGRTSLDLMKEGENSLQRWIATSRNHLMPAPFDPTAMFVTPGFEASTLAQAGDLAARQAAIETGAVTQELEGQKAAIAGQASMYQSIGNGLQSMAGLYAGNIGTGSGGGAPAVPKVVGGGYQYTSAGGFTPASGTPYRSYLNSY